MKLTIPSLRSLRRPRVMEIAAAAVALMLPATLGLGTAPASASMPEESLAGVRTVTVQFQTQWTTTSPNVKTIRIQGFSGTPVAGFEHCYPMGEYTPGDKLWPYIKVDLPEGSYNVASYDGPSCDVQYQTAGGYGPMQTDYFHNWMVHATQGPTARA